MTEQDGKLTDENQAEKIKIDKINALAYLLESSRVDETQPSFSETRYVQTFNEEECYTIKAKLFEIIKQL